jgi:hypothetical protein
MYFQYEVKAMSNKLEFKVVVNGIEVSIEPDVNAPLSAIIPQVLEKAQVKGQPPENWTVNDAAGNELPLNKKIGEFGFTEKTVLFLNLKVGVGG